MNTIGTLPGIPNLWCRVIWRQMIGREGPMATPLRPGNVVEVINVLSLPFCPEGLFECLKRHRSVIMQAEDVLSDSCILT
jgi:hypothetical protein